MTEIIERLRDDSEYYGDFGRQYLSYSMVGLLLSDPRGYLQPREETKAMLEGRLFHQLLIEPQKAAEWLEQRNFVDASTRTTKVYKDYCAERGIKFALLLSEVEAVKAMAYSVRSNIMMYDMMYADGNEYEAPAVGIIHGEKWKGKADIVCNDKVIDLKTTGDISRFKYSARAYNYDAQAYIYQQLFGKELVFIAVDKDSYQLGVFTPSAEFLSYGEEKVKRAVAVWQRYFGPDAVDDVSNHYINEVL